MLTNRQEKLLKSIIEEFMDTASAVGSMNVKDKYKLDVSPATIRNEMSKLSELGLLEKSHASSGRIPTSSAFKWFLDEISDELDQIDVLHSSTLREALFQKRFDADRLLNEAVTALADMTGNTAIAVINGKRYTSGLHGFLDQPEYKDDLDRLKRILQVMEDYNQLVEMFANYSGKEVKVLLGEETGIDDFSESAVAFAKLYLHGGNEGYIGVIGPNRMKYRKVIPALKYIAKNVQDVVEGW